MNQTIGIFLMIAGCGVIFWLGYIWRCMREDARLEAVKEDCARKVNHWTDRVMEVQDLYAELEANNWNLENRLQHANGLLSETIRTYRPIYRVSNLLDRIEKWLETQRTEE